MNFKVIGTGMHNQGAELMAYAISDAIHNSEFVGPVVADDFGSPADYLRNGLSRTFDIGGKVRGALLNRLFNSEYRELLSLPRSEDIDWYLDASGFAYSDQWGVERSLKLKRRVEAFGECPCRYIVMPQAFGPFKSADVRAAVKDALPRIPLVCVRDQTSLNHVRELIGDTDNVSLYRDFTNLVRALPSIHESQTEGAAVIVPNVRMLDKTDQEVSENYVATLNLLIKRLKRSFKVCVLIHSSDDVALANCVSNGDEAISVIVERNPRRMKALLANAALVVGSRFHALQSALDGGTPIFSLGWSHKYEELCADYQWERGVLPVTDGVSAVLAHFEGTLKCENLQATRSKLEGRASALRQESLDMWEKVFTTIGEAVSSNS